MRPKDNKGFLRRRVCGGKSLVVQISSINTNTPIWVRASGIDSFGAFLKSQVGRKSACDWEKYADINKMLSVSNANVFTKSGSFKFQLFPSSKNI
jgi:hypothetical protein